VLLGALAAAAVFGPALTPDPEATDLDSTFAPPSGQHWLGTDSLGRDQAARVFHGARVSLAVGALAAAIALAIGVPLGALAGYKGGPIDAFVSRLAEVVLSFPTLILALALLAVPFDSLAALPDTVRVAFVLGAVGWVPVTRYVRGEFLRISRSEMVQAARSLGGGHVRIMARHILPSALAPILVTAAFAVSSAITFEAALSFLGLGVRPPIATWGGLLLEASRHLVGSWWLTVFPGAALFAAVLGFNLIGEGIRDWLDPRRQVRETLPDR
jgi:peptide/nickel transport system permease protein